MKNIILAFVAVVLLAACSNLSDEAKEIIGDYYVPAISASEPLMELRADGTCVNHAISENLSIAVPGTWNVVNDSLIMDLDPSKLTFKGDSTLMGTIRSHIARKIVNFDGARLTLLVDGNQVVYERRGQVKE